MPRSRTPRLAPRPRTVTEPLESRTLLSAGDPDPAFGVGGVAYPSFSVPGVSRPEAVAIAPGNKVVVAGAARLSVENPTAVPALARFNADGSPDAGFDGDGWAPVNSTVIPAAVAVQADGKVLTAATDPA